MHGDRPERQREHHLHVHQQQARQRWSPSRTPSPTTRRTSLHGGRRAARRRASRSTTTPTRRCRTRRPSRTSRPARSRPTRSPRACRPRWAQTAATCNNGNSPTAITISARARPSPAPSPTSSAARSTSSRTRRPTTRRTSPSPPAAASRRRASRSTTTPTRRCRTRAASRTWCRRPATRSRRPCPTGWDQTSATCSDGSAVTNIDVGSGETVTCTFANRKRGRIIVVKDATPDDPQDFALHAPAAGSRPSSFSLDDDANATLSNTQTFNNVVPGSGYSLAETVPCGLGPDLGHLRRRQPDHEHQRRAPARRSPARSSNRKRGQIIAVKDAVPNDPQDFAFTAGGGLSPASFSARRRRERDAVEHPDLQQRRAGRRLLARRDACPTGWDQTSRDLQRRQPARRTSTSAPARSVTCTFVNTQARPALTVVKDAVPNDPQDFAFTAGGGLSPASFPLDDDADPTLSNTPHVHQRRCPAPATRCPRPCPSGWDQASATCSDGSPVSNIDLSAGENVTCTFTNNKRGRDRGRQGRAARRPAGLLFTAGGGLSPASFPLDDDADPTLSNTQTFNDVAAGSGYSRRRDACRRGWDQSERHVRRRQPGRRTSTSRRRDGHLHVHEPQARPDRRGQGRAARRPAGLQLHRRRRPQPVELLARRRRRPDALEHAHVLATSPAGSGYSLAETSPPAGTRPARLQRRQPGLEHRRQRRRDRHLHVHQPQARADRRRRGRAARTTRRTSPSRPAAASARRASRSTTTPTRRSRTRARSRTSLPGVGYSLSRDRAQRAGTRRRATCDDGSPVSNIDVSAGETVTCTFTNRKRGQIVVVKDAQPNDPQDFAFTAGGGLSPSSFSLDDDSDPTLSNTRTFTNVVAGQRLLARRDRAGGLGPDRRRPATTAARVSNIDVSAGRDGHLHVHEHASADSSSSSRTRSRTTRRTSPSRPAAGLSPSSFSLDDDSDRDALEHAHVHQRRAGQRLLARRRPVPSGWDQTGATCDDGSPVVEHRRQPGRDASPAPSRTASAARSSSSRTRSPNDPQDFSFTAGGGLSPGELLSSTTTPTRRCPNTQHVHQRRRRAAATRVAETVPERLGPDQSPPATTAARCRTSTSSAGETVTCTFTNRKRGQIVVVKDAQPERPAGLHLHGRRRPLPDELLARRRLRTRRSPNTQHLQRTSSPGARLLARRDRAQPAGTRPRATCDDGSPVVEHRRRRRARPSPARSRTASAGRSSSSRTRTPERSRRTSPSRPAAGSRPPSFSLDDDSDPTLSNTQTFNNVVPGSGYSVVGDRARRLGPDVGRPATTAARSSNIDVGAGRDRHLHVHQPQARPDRRRQGRRRPTTRRTSPSRPAAGFAGELPARRRRRPDAVQHAARSPTCPRHAATRSPRPCPAAGTRRGHLRRRQPGRRTSTSAAGETVTCTFTNPKRAARDRGQGRRSPNDPQDFSFTAGGGLSPASFSLDDDSDPTLSEHAHVHERPRPAAATRVAETVPGRLGPDSARPATTAARSRTSTSAPGEHVTCTFTNRKRGQIVVVKDSTPNDPQDFTFTAGGGLSPASFQLDDDADPDALRTRARSPTCRPGRATRVSETRAQRLGPVERHL